MSCANIDWVSDGFSQESVHVFSLALMMISGGFFCFSKVRYWIFPMEIRVYGFPKLRWIIFLGTKYMFFWRTNRTPGILRFPLCSDTSRIFPTSGSSLLLRFNRILETNAPAPKKDIYLPSRCIVSLFPTDWNSCFETFDKGILWVFLGRKRAFSPV